jgi:hypothetical protein
LVRAFGLDPIYGLDPALASIRYNALSSCGSNQRVKRSRPEAFW